MPELTYRKRLSVLRLYLAGHSHQVIAENTEVAKGSVPNTIMMLKDGLPVLGGIEDQMDALRQVAVQVRRNGLALSQAAVGLTAFQSFVVLGLAPGDSSKIVAL